MSKKHFEHFKPTFLDNFIIETGGWGFVILFTLGIWVDDFRWKLIFSSIFLFALTILHYLVLEDKDKKLKEREDEK